MSNKKYSKTPDYLTQDSQAEVIVMSNEPTIAEVNIRKKESSLPANQQVNHKISEKFGSHLDALFQDPPPLERAEPKPSETNSRIASRKKRVLPRMGLDSLIRNTRMLSSENAKENDELKRVTFIYSRNQLEKVRQISKYESRFMKDIIGEAVNQWLERYERKLMQSKS